MPTNFNPHEARSSWPKQDIRDLEYQHILIHTKREARGDGGGGVGSRDVDFNPHEARSSWQKSHTLDGYLSGILIHTKREARGAGDTVQRRGHRNFNPHEARSSWPAKTACPTTEYTF